MLATLPPATRSLLLLTVGIFLVQLFAPQWVARWPLYPLGAGFQPFQLLTYALLHGGFAHIAFNMIGLMSFGAALERRWGEQRLYILYIVSVVVAGLTQLFVNALMHSSAATVGASGGVFGLLLAYAVLYPEHRLAVMFIPVPVPARVFAAGYAALELYLGVTSQASGVAHFAHLGGMLGAAVLLLMWRKPVR